jgi:hypothetical protein
MQKQKNSAPRPIHLDRKKFKTTPKSPEQPPAAAKSEDKTNPKKESEMKIKRKAKKETPCGYRDG